ncbi:MAG: hypothetical protein AB8G05_23110 [Oligoflexales bacterium]
MHQYDGMRQKYSVKVCQTVDNPITVFDYFELSEVFVALGAMLLFGIVVSSWKMMLISLILTLGVGPYVRRRNQKGIYFHYPYRRFGMRLPGLINPRGKKRFSD